MALYPLCRHGRQPRAALRHAAGVIERQVSAVGEQQDFLTLLGIFGKLGYPQLDVSGIIGREKMKESKLYQEIMQEGELIQQRADILRILTLRFGDQVAADLTASLEAIGDLDRLGRLLDVAVTGADPDEFRAALHSHKSGR